MLFIGKPMGRSILISNIEERGYWGGQDLIQITLDRHECFSIFHHLQKNKQRKQRHSLKLGKKRRESPKRNYYIISPRAIIKAIIIILQSNKSNINPNQLQFELHVFPFFPRHTNSWEKVRVFQEIVLGFGKFGISKSWGFPRLAESWGFPESWWFQRKVGNSEKLCWLLALGNPVCSKMSTKINHSIEVGTSEPWHRVLTFGLRLVPSLIQIPKQIQKQVLHQSH